MTRLSQQSSFSAKAPFMPLTIAVAVGIVLARLVDMPLVLSASIFSVLVVIAVAAYFKNFLPDEKFSRFFLLLFLLIGLIHFSFWKEHTLDQPYLAHLPVQADTAKAVVTSMQKRERIKAVVELQELQRDSITIEAAGKLLVYFPYRYRGPIFPGQTINMIDARIEALPEPRNPGQFDYGAFLRWQGVVAQCKINDSLKVNIKPAPPVFSLENRLFYPLRQQLIWKIEWYFSPAASSFLKALLLGAREDLNDDIIEDFQKAGVMHVLAISGLHVGFVALIFYILLSFFPIYFKRRNILVIVLLVLYMFLTGSNPPVVRATLMAAFYFLAINLERKGAVYNYLFAAAFIILLFQPQQLFRVGFQFSFAAVLSIVYFFGKLEPPVEKALEFISSEKWRHRLKNWLVIPFLVSLAAQLGTIPLVMHYFHKLSLISFFLNIIVIPYIGMLVAIGFFFLLLSFISGVLAEVVANFLAFLIDLLIRLVSGAAGLPGAFFNISTFSLLGILLYSAFVLLIFNLQKLTVRRFFATALIVLLLAWGSINLLRQPAFNLIMMDVGQGDGMLLTTPREKVVMIDTGPANEYNSAADFALIPTLQHLGIKTVNYLFITHPHLDHLGGTFRLLEYAHVDSVFLTPIPVSYHWNDTLLQVLNRCPIPYRFLKLGDRLVVDEETRIYSLGPFPRFIETPLAGDYDLNNSSLVLLVKHRDHSILFTGDAEAEAEIYLELWGDVLKSDILKVAHHGSKTSTTKGILTFIRPEISAISVAKRNKFGHPSPQVLERLSGYGSKIFRTDRQKAIWLRLKKGQWKRLDWE